MRLNTEGRRQPITAVDVDELTIDRVVVRFLCGHTARITLVDPRLLGYWIGAMEAIEKGWRLSAPCPGCPRESKATP